MCQYMLCNVYMYMLSTCVSLESMLHISFRIDVVIVNIIVTPIVIKVQTILKELPCQSFEMQELIFCSDDASSQ